MKKLDEAGIQARLDRLLWLPLAGITLSLYLNPEKLQVAASSLLSYHKISAHQAEKLKAYSALVIHQDDLHNLGLGLIYPSEIEEKKADPNKPIQVSFFTKNKRFLELFAESMQGLLTSMRLCPGQRKLEGLLTSRQKKCLEFAETLKAECLTNKLVVELQELGLEIRATLEGIDDKLPQIVFRISCAGETIGTVILDGWSTLMLTNEIPSKEAYSDPGEFQNAVWQCVNDYLEKPVTHASTTA